MTDREAALPAPEGRLPGIDGRRTGTQDLVHDLDTLRKAVGSETLSIWGISYGTVVGAAYATVYPERVDKLVLDGNVAVFNEIYAAAELFALSYEQVWNGIASACDADYFLNGGLQACAEPGPCSRMRIRSLGF